MRSSGFDDHFAVRKYPLRVPVWFSKRTGQLTGTVGAFKESETGTVLSNTYFVFLERLLCISNGVGNSAAGFVCSSGIPGLCVGGKSTMSSVAVLTQESFAEHRSGLAQQQVKGEKTQLGSCDTPLNAECTGKVPCCYPSSLRMSVHPFLDWWPTKLWLTSTTSSAAVMLCSARRRQAPDPYRALVAVPSAMGQGIGLQESLVGAVCWAGISFLCSARSWGKPV